MHGEKFVSTLRTHLENIAGQVYDDEALRDALQSCSMHFDTYAEHQRELLLRLLDEEPESQRKNLVAFRNHLTEFLYPMVVPFHVTRKRVRRWIRSCEGAAWQGLQDGRTPNQIFTPEVQATLVEAFAEYSAFPTDETLEELRAELPRNSSSPCSGRQKIQTFLRIIQPSKPANEYLKALRERGND